MAIQFSITRNRGLEFSFANESTEVPEGSHPLWDFGDSITSQETEPAHTFDQLGEYNVKLTIGDSFLVKKLIISTYTKSIISIEDISTGYIPDILSGHFSGVKTSLIDKWLLYLQPIVNHEIPINKYFDESLYEALEVRLLGELVAYDFLSSEVTKNMVGTIVSNALASEESEESSSEGEIKKIVTGPTEAEFFSQSETSSKMVKALSDIGKPGGIMDTLKMNICQLASRLDIYLPMCGLPQPIRSTFKVVKRG